MSLEEYVKEFDSLVEEYTKFADDIEGLTSAKYRIYVKTNKFEEAAQQLSLMKQMHEEGRT